MHHPVAVPAEPRDGGDARVLVVQREARLIPTHIRRSNPIRRKHVSRRSGGFRPVPIRNNRSSPVYTWVG
eukprot:8816220-Pyramimonas_sp.AAC.1